MEPPPTPEEDPWNWSVEEVVKQLCSANGGLRISAPNITLDPSFSDKILQNDITGSVLLTAIDDACLRSDLGLISIGKRAAVTIFVDELRASSIRYYRYVHRKASVVPSIQGTQSNFDRASIYGHDLTPISHTVDRFLLEPLATPQRKAIQELQVNDGLQNQDERGQPNGVSKVPAKVGTTLRRKAIHELQVNDVLQNQDERGQHEGINDSLTKVGITLRQGESYAVDKTGRKRRKLQLEPAVPIIPSPNGEENATDRRSVSKTAEQDHPDLYLNKTAFSVENMFYGNTPMGHEIDSGNQPSSDPNNFYIIHNGSQVSGQRLAVNSCMKYYLLHGTETSDYNYNGHKVLGIVPYRSRIAKRHQTQSMTVFERSPFGTRALRVDRSKCLDVGTQLTVDPISKDPELTTAEKSLVEKTTGIETREWDFLEKWLDVESTENVLPQYGDSETSEGGFDSDTYREIEEERLEKLKELAKATKNKHLSADECARVIETSIQDITENWRAKKLPQLNHKARRIWQKSRRQRTKHLQLVTLYRDLDRLNVRLGKLKKELVGEQWSVATLKTQCKCMEATVFDQEYDKWKISILTSTSAPAKLPTPFTKPIKTAKSSRLSSESLSDEDEDSSDDEIPFIDLDESDSEGYVQDEQMDDLPGLEELSEPDEIPFVERQIVRIAIPEPVQVICQESEHAEEGDNYQSLVEDDIELPDLDPVARLSDTESISGGVLAVSEAEGITGDLESEEVEIQDAESEELEGPSEGLEEPSERLEEPSEEVDIHDEQSEEPEVQSDELEVDTADFEAVPAIEKKTSGDEELVDSLSQTKETTDSDSDLFVPLLPQQPSTQQSTSLSADMAESPSPMIKEEYRTTRRPVVEEDDPFRIARKVKAVFRQPPVPLNVINLDTDEDEPEDEEASEYFKRHLPPMEDLTAFTALTQPQLEYLMKIQDRDRILFYTVIHCASDARRQAIRFMEKKTSISIQPEIWDGLDALMNYQRNIKGKEADLSAAIMQIATWYVSWHQCKTPNEKYGWDRDLVKSTIAAETGFEKFFDVLRRFLSRYAGDSTKSARRNDGNERFQVSKQTKLNQTLEDSDDSADLDRNISGKKRKRPVAESQAGLELRVNAHQRAKDQEIRRKKFQKERDRMSSKAQIVVINPGKSDDQEIITVNPAIAAIIQPHQIDGVQFMWREIVTDQAKQGCLLAHTMGLGKTMQIVTLLVTIGEASKHSSENVRNQIPEELQESCTLVLCPPALVENWHDEFLKWTPQDALDSIGSLRRISSTMKWSTRLYEIEEWAKSGGVLLLGYHAFRNLIENKAGGTKAKRVSGQTRNEESEDDSSEERRPPRLDEDQHQRILNYLLERPNIIVADEAHYMKNPRSSISRTARQFRSKRRIALTGSPLSNNLEEYYQIIDWVAPNYLGEAREFRSKYVEPIQESLYQDAKPYAKRNGLKMLAVLKEELEPKTNRKDITILREQLQGKTEFVIRVPLTDLQKEAYQLYISSLLSTTKNANEPRQTSLWAWLSVLRLLCNHPKCFRDKLTTKPDKKALAAKKTRATAPIDIDPFDKEADELLAMHPSALGIDQEMIDQQLKLLKRGEPLDSIIHSHKLEVLMQILAFAREAKDKVLVFTHSLDTLDYIERQLKIKHSRYLRLDGKTPVKDRQEMASEFNNGKPEVFLISTGAGSTGLNMFGANRVVIVDDHFNPMHEEQAIGRSYRIGQKKHVYVYRLTVAGTFEVALQNQSLFKTQLATRVVDKKNPVRFALKGSRQYLFAPKEIEQEDLSGFAGRDVYVLDRILASQADRPIIRSIDLSETFHREIVEELTPEEKLATAELIQDARLRRTDPDAYQKKQARLVEQSNHSAHNAYLDSLRAQEHARLLALRGPALSQNFPQGAISNPITIMEQAISRLPPPGLFIPSHDYANAAPISVEEQARKLELSKTMWGTKQPNPTSARSTARVPPAVPFTLPTSVQPVLNPLTPVAVPNTGLGPAPITWDAKRIDEITKTFKLRRKQDVDADGAAHTASTEDGNSSSPQREAAVENGTMASQPADRGGDDSSPGRHRLGSPSKNCKMN